MSIFLTVTVKKLITVTDVLCRDILAGTQPFVSCIGRGPFMFRSQRKLQRRF